VAAFSLGQIIGGGELDRNEVEHQLFQAAGGLVADDGKSSVKATITSGIRAGIKEPRSTPTTPEHAPVLKTAMLQSAAKIKYVCAADVKQKPVIWIWKGRLAKGKMTILSGDPGLGKSQIANYMIACITKGDSWCDDGVAPQGNCIVLSAEDADDDTICPRLEVLGANLRRVQIIKSVMKDGQDHSVSLAHDLSALADMIQEIGNVVLIVIDPITAYLGDKIDSHQTTAVRAILEPVSQFAEQQNIAILAITHPPKASQSKAMHSFTGSLAFVAAARIALLAVEEPETERKLLLGVKNNLKKLPDGLAYHMRETTTDEGIEACHIIWESNPVDITANEAVRSNRDGAGKIKEAEEFLKNYLKDQVVPSQEVLNAASANGIKQPTLYRAKKNVGVISEKSHFESGWTWSLPT
jgi:energy-coupling factor transporter ATP-binding protein EcfA2